MFELNITCTDNMHRFVSESIQKNDTKNDRVSQT